MEAAAVEAAAVAVVVRTKYGKKTGSVLITYIEEPSRNSCRSGKAISITYSEFVCILASVLHHFILKIWLAGATTFLHIISSTSRFWKKTVY